MKPNFDPHRHFAGVVLACCMVAAAVATEPSSSPMASPIDDKQQLLKLDQAWADAEDKHDEAALRRILDEKFVGTFSSGRTYNKEAFIKAILAIDVDPTFSQSLSYEAVIIDGDTAVLVGTDTERGTKDGAAHTAVSKYTVTYIRRNGLWLALAEQFGHMPQSK